MQRKINKNATPLSMSTLNMMMKISTKKTVKDYGNRHGCLLHKKRVNVAYMCECNKLIKDLRVPVDRFNDLFEVRQYLIPILKRESAYSNTSTKPHKTRGSLSWQESAFSDLKTLYLQERKE